jgi:hypothetical protein
MASKVAAAIEAPPRKPVYWTMVSIVVLKLMLTS